MFLCSAQYYAGIYSERMKEYHLGMMLDHSITMVDTGPRAAVTQEVERTFSTPRFWWFDLCPLQSTCQSTLE